MRIVIELKRGSEAQIVLNQLYKHTQMQESFSMIFLAVVNGQPRELPLPDAIRHFIDHRVDVVRRRTAYLLRKAREREHILLGYQIALDHLDNVIKIIRGSSLPRRCPREPLPVLLRHERSPLRGAALKGVTLDRGEVRHRHGDPDHGHADPQLSPDRRHPRTAALSPDPALHRRAAEGAERGPRQHRRVRIDSRLGEEAARGHRQGAEAVRKDFGDERRTQILDETAELQLEDLIADEQVAVTVSHSGYLKRTPISTYRQQRRGGTGRLGMKTREEDFVSQLIVDSTHAYLLCFTNTGRVYWLKVYEIPDVGAAGKGKSMASLLNLQPGETVRTILAHAQSRRGRQVRLLRDAQRAPSRRRRSRTSPM